MSMCCFRTKALPNKSPHSSHLCTFSPVWVILCFLKVPASPNDFLHSEQVWIFTPLWMSMCVFRESARPNDFLHRTQVCIFSLLWTIIYAFSSFLLDQMTSYILSKGEPWPQCEWTCAFSDCELLHWTQVKFCSVVFIVLLQVSCLIKGGQGSISPQVLTYLTVPDRT